MSRSDLMQDPLDDALTGTPENSSINSGQWMALAAAGCLTVAANAQKDSFTPMALDAGFGKMDITAPTTPIKIATTRSTVKRSRKNTLARTAASGGKRLNSRTACPALVSLAPNADSAFVPGP